MIHLTKPDVNWLTKLLDVVEGIHDDYPELFSKEDRETLKITRQLIRSLNT